ncbi:MAG: NUDIX hydrolase [Cryobacterium sp.]|uniref:NUDIX domain-containing protein n=1 Tax=unclassified Cryobacterium TaxID=2649013 RepID=UPI0018CB3F5B|nr:MULTISPECIES: NUDIX hydrolase [unclassified Cryobacterium]MCY7403676.1 NUDIX hydrolase [Cryobacterium sp.]MEC5155667.1 8-oxo-dGTP pyrophosphatase MutT (NUDIX family) [Cryobacterium sp. CAN_C3]
MPDGLLQDDVLAVELTASDVVYDGAIWDVRRDSFAYNGTNITREYLDHPGAVAVLALDEHDRVLLIKQYRHPTGLRGWELPAGLLDVTGENAVVGAQRELAEEADVVASEWALLTEFYTSPGGSNEAIRVYLARSVSAVAAFDRTDEEADIELRWVPLDECVDAVMARRIANPILIVGVLSAQVARSRGWSTLAPADLPWPRHSLNRNITA